MKKTSDAGLIALAGIGFLEANDNQDHPAPLFGFFCHQLAEIYGRAAQAAHDREPEFIARFDARACQASVDFVVQNLHDTDPERSHTVVKF